ncbi:MAG: hypothetical protein UGF89_10120, partial [Acutalibacteraceae bacterium]|nr:hypothetical protein [Acutalibacteraceae bacterium]
YYKPGTFNTGFDVWVENREFSDDNKSFEAEFKYYGNNEKFTVIVAMNEEKKDYKVILNGIEVPYTVRDESAIEITIDGNNELNKLVIK